MAISASAARRHRGGIIAGDEGRELIESSEAVMAAQQIEHPGRISRMVIPGFS